jgi:hypothetical protein
MIDYAVFIGFFTCHAIWSIEDGEMLVPFYAHEFHGTRKLDRYPGDNKENVDKLKMLMTKNRMNYTYSLIAYDGYVTLNSVKKDAIFIEAYSTIDHVEYKVVMAIPYRGAKSDKGFAIYKPKTLETNVKDIEKFVEGFWNGVNSHEKGSEAWNKYIDQSE